MKIRGEHQEADPTQALTGSPEGVGIDANTDDLSDQLPNSWFEQLRGLLKLTGPLVIVQAGYQLTGLVDTALAGQVGALTVAATGLGSTAFFAISVFGIGVMLGIDPLAAQAFGAGTGERARHILWQGLYLATLLSLPLMLAVLIFAKALPWLGVVPEVAAESMHYVLGRMPSLWPLLLSVTLRSYLQAAHVTRHIVWAAIVTNIFNFVADWVLLFGDAGLERWGLPAVGLEPLGTAGIGWSSTVATTAQALVLARAALITVRREAPGTRPWPRPNRREISEVARVGIPVGLHLVAEVGIFSLVGVLIGGMGADALAAHQVALMLSSMTFSACLGIGSATSVQVGRAVGALNRVATRRAGLLGIGIGSGFMTLTAIVMWWWPEMLAGWMTSQPEVIAASVGLIRIAGFFQIADGASTVAAGALRGLGETRFVFLANVVSHWLVGLPLGVTLAYGADLGPRGLWWGLSAGLAVAATVVAARFVWRSSQHVAPISS